MRLELCREERGGGEEGARVQHFWRQGSTIINSGYDASNDVARREGAVFFVVSNNIIINLGSRRVGEATR